MPCGLSAGKGLLSSIEAIYTSHQPIYSSVQASIELNRAGGSHVLYMGAKTCTYIHTHARYTWKQRWMCGGFVHAIKNKKIIKKSKKRNFSNLSRAPTDCSFIFALSFQFFLKEHEEILFLFSRC